jgi:hypothetical protein
MTAAEIDLLERERGKLLMPIKSSIEIDKLKVELHER